jgi:hypothetical protein
VSYVSFDDADLIGDRFLALLAKLKINPPVGSRLEDDLLSITQLIDVIKDPNLARGSDEARTIRTAAAVHDFAAKILAIDGIDEFDRFIPHLQLISHSKLPKELADPSITQMSESLDDAARKMAELYLGTLIAHFGTDVVLDSPTRNKGKRDNPDVLFTCQESTPNSNPRRWTLAIKTISSSQGQTIFERVEDGVDQIDAPECPADVGLIVINTKNALNHKALWDAHFADEASAKRALFDQIMELILKAEKDRPQSDWDELFVGKAVRPILFLGQSVVRLSTSPGGPHTPVALKMLIAHAAHGTPDSTGWAIAHFMNEYMQQILLGKPGAPGQQPR